MTLARRWRIHARVLALTAGVFSLAVASPAVAQEGAAEQEAEPAGTSDRVHEVRRGDTLWDLAGRYLTDPFQWPRLFELNTHVVEDPHWIYPGELLVLPDAVQVARRPGLELEEADLLEPRDTGRQGVWERSGVSGFGGRSIFDESPDFGSRLGDLGIETYGAPVLVSENDFYRAPRLVEVEAIAHTGRTVRKIEGNILGLSMPAGIQLYDRVVIALDRLDVIPGDELRAFRWAHGIDGRRVARSMAMLEVTEASEASARAWVIRLYGDYAVGDPVMLAEAFDVPPTLAQAVDDEGPGLTARVVGFEIPQPVLGEGDMVFLDVGADAGVGIGDEFAVFDRDETAAARWEDRLAVLRIVRVEPGTSTGRVVDLRDTSPREGSPARRTLRAVGG